MMTYVHFIFFIKLNTVIIVKECSKLTTVEILEIAIWFIRWMNASCCMIRTTHIWADFAKNQQENTKTNQDGNMI